MIHHLVGEAIKTRHILQGKSPGVARLGRAPLSRCTCRPAAPFPCTASCLPPGPAPLPCLLLPNSGAPSKPYFPRNAYYANPCIGVVIWSCSALSKRLQCPVPLGVVCHIVVTLEDGGKVLSVLACDVLVCYPAHVLARQPPGQLLVCQQAYVPGLHCSALQAVEYCCPLWLQEKP